MLIQFAAVLLLALLPPSGFAAGTPAPVARSVDIGAGLSISVPSGWNDDPVPLYQGAIKDLRYTTPGLRMAITTFPLPKGVTIPEMEDIPALARKGMTPYLGSSVEGAATSTDVHHDGIDEAYASLTAKPGGAGFNVYPGELHPAHTYACVTTAVGKLPGAWFVLSIASDDCDGSAYGHAVDVVKSIRRRGA